MIYAVAGCRDYKHYEPIANILRTYIIFGRDTIVTGDATGIDTITDQFGKRNNIPVGTFKANWHKYDLAAGPIRNEKMIKECDELIAFWDGKSKGTRNSIGWAVEMRKPIHIYWI